MRLWFSVLSAARDPMIRCASNRGGTYPIHYLALLLTPKKPTRRDVERALRYYWDFDFFRIGGRWAGYIGGAREIKRRYTDIIGSGPGHDALTPGNFGRLHDLRSRLAPVYVLVNGERLIEVRQDRWPGLLRRLKRERPRDYATVIDAHGS